MSATASSLFRRITSSSGGQFSKYFSFPQNVDHLRKQLIYRSCNMGMLELDLIVGKWAKQNVPGLSYEECLQYNKEILEQETPDLYRTLLKERDEELLKTNKFYKELRNYIEAAPSQND